MDNGSVTSITINRQSSQEEGKKPCLLKYKSLPEYKSGTKVTKKRSARRHKKHFKRTITLNISNNITINNYYTEKQPEKTESKSKWSKVVKTLKVINKMQAHQTKQLVNSV